MSSEIKYPDIKVKLSGRDGNAMTIVAAVTRALRNNDVPSVEVDIFFDEVMSGDYDNVLRTAARWVYVY